MAGEGLRDGSRHLVSREEFDRALLDSLTIARDRGKQAALLIVRIDDIGKVADRWGDDAAAAVRRWMASTIASALRADDVCTHDGADDFAILRRRISRQGASAFGYRIRARVTQLPCPIRNAKDAHFLTVSIGIAHTTSAGVPERAGLMAVAVRGAERAQEAGGNRVCEAA